nr:SusC/RagA family TonB-linked outer membrane protein [Bacteroidales bacterium]
MENSFNKKSTFFKLLSVAFVLCAFTWSALAQNVIVKGVVKDTDGQTVIGASVLQKGTLNGVTTDADGAFQLTVPSNATLQISFIGYKTVEVAVNNRTSINVTLEEDRQMLEETVVIGYGTAKRSDVTGSISSVNQDVIRQIPAGDITAALQGRIAGVEMRQTSNSPGATMRIRIRGTRSLSASNDPLIVLDGIPFSGSLQDINTDDVKSIDILKDASSTAIYGSRGANGVIMITTEHGQQGQPARVNFNSYASYKQWIPYPFMNTQQYTTMRDLAKKYNDTPDENRDLYDTDWQAIYYEPGYSIQNNLTVTGGTNGGHYSFGLGYYKDESNIPTEGFDRINVRASLDQGIGKYFTFGFSTNLGLNKNYGNAGGAQTDLTPMINPWIDPAKGNV